MVSNISQDIREDDIAKHICQKYFYEPLGMKKAIHVQAAIGSADPVEETKWLEEVFIQTGIPNAIVGHVDLRAPNAREVIEKHLKYQHFKGIRDFSYGDYLVNKDFRKGFVGGNNAT